MPTPAAPDALLDADPAYAPTTRRNGVFTDLENATRFAEQHGAGLRYSDATGWLVWTGVQWESDEAAVIQLAKASIRELYSIAAKIDDEDKRRQVIGRILHSESASRIRGLVELAKSEPGIPIKADSLDADPWLLNAHNGTLDLRTGKLREHRREDLLTKMAPVAYDPAAECPTWQTFLERVLVSPDLVAFVQRVIGYALTGDTREQCFFLLHGSGQNGKSTFLEVIRHLLGGYAMNANTNTFLTRRGSGVRSDIARLRGARFVTAIEAEAGKHLAEALVKQLTGGDIMTARHLYREEFEFRPTFKLFMAVNHKPEVRGTDHAIWRRIHLIPFEVTIPKEEQDKHLVDKLRAELPGILRWAVDGCLAWQEKGLNPPAEVLDATEAYRAEHDVLMRFMGERCVRDPGGRIPSTTLYEAYGAWCRKTGLSTPWAHKEFSSGLKDRGLASQHTKTGAVWPGWRLREGGDQDATAPDEAADTASQG